MPRGDRYIRSLFPANAGKAIVRAHVLTYLEAHTLVAELGTDAKDFYYSAWVTFLDALNGAESGLYTWAAVKLYYCVFYSLRASLADRGFCAFHVGNTQYTVNALAGHSPITSPEKGTHKTVLRAFSRENPGHALNSQKIGVDDAADWLMHLREEANYTRSPFMEPDCASQFRFLQRRGVRGMLNEYLRERGFAYIFDPDHAVLAYPLRALQLIGEQLLASGAELRSNEERRFIRKCAQDRNGNYAELTREITRLV